MGCVNNKENTLERPGGGKLIVWGDYFNSDTRTLLAILEIAGVAYDFKEVDTFKDDHKKPEYLLHNPAGQIPMITESSYKILGGSNHIVLYLAY